MKLKRELGALEVFAIATGAMISSGLFVLPSIAFNKTGPSVFLAYLAASIMIIPALVSKAELSTAMPKSGGTYFFIQRSLGPLFGTFAGFSGWISLGLKSAFALVGIGVFLEPLIPGLGPNGVKIIATLFTLFFMVMNIFSVKHSGRFQTYFVGGLLVILLVYLVMGLPRVNVHNYVPFMLRGGGDFWAAAGMIFISFGGLTKIASIAEEVKNPGKNIPLGMFSAYVVVSLIYVLAVFVTVGVLSTEEMEGSLTPISEGAGVFMGTPGKVLLSLAAMMAFITTANAGLMAASRSPMAMAEDHLIPGFFARISIRFNTPVVSILMTGAFMIALILGLDLEKLVKAASTIMLLLFLFVCVSVIVMRESKIPSYKPQFKMPLYPLLPVLGILMYGALIPAMGLIPVVMTVVFLLGVFLWYLFYSKSRSDKDSALIHMVEKASNTEIHSDTLSSELMDILRDRDNIVEDRFDALIREAEVLDIQEEMTQDGLFQLLAETFAQKQKLNPEEVKQLFWAREKESTTMIAPGLAIPHIILPGEDQFEIIVLRARKGILFNEESQPVHQVFALGGSKNERNFHLQALMAIAQIVQNEGFSHNWLRARNTQELRHQILLAERVRKGDL